MFFWAVWNKLSGANFCFRLLWFCVFLVVVCLRFCFMVWRFVPKVVLKMSLHVRFFYWGGGVVLSALGFSCQRRLGSPFCFGFLREKAQLATGHHTPLHVLDLCCILFFFFSPHFCFRPFWPRVLFFLRFFRVPFWTPRCLAKIIFLLWPRLRLGF